VTHHLGARRDAPFRAVSPHIEREDRATDDLQREPLKERHQVDRTVDRGQTIGQSIGYRDNLPRQEVSRPRRERGRHLAPLLPPIAAGAEKQPTLEHRPQRGRRYSPNATRRELASDNRR
jgi:hypothetical protein